MSRVRADYDSKVSVAVKNIVFFVVLIMPYFLFSFPVAIWTTLVIGLWARATGELLRETMRKQ